MNKNLKKAYEEKLRLDKEFQDRQSHRIDDDIKLKGQSPSSEGPYTGSNSYNNQPLEESRSS